jgi:HrpA-like RNA helicase
MHKVFAENKPIPGVNNSLVTRGTDRKHLPIEANEKEFINLLGQRDVIVLVRETGSGKTTKIRGYCLDFLL